MEMKELTYIESRKYVEIHDSFNEVTICQPTIW